MLSVSSKELEMNHEIQELINEVKKSSKPVQEVVDAFFANIGWSQLKDEYNQMNDAQKRFLIAKLNTERK
jgi:hypothetical protein